MAREILERETPTFAPGDLTQYSEMREVDIGSHQRLTNILVPIDEDLTVIDRKEPEGR